MIKLVKMKAMKILYQMNQCQRLKIMSTPLRNLVGLLTMKSITMKKVRRYMIIEAVLRSVQEAGFIHSFIHSGHFYSAPSSPLLLRGAPDYSTDTVSEFHAEAHRQLQVKDLPKVPTWRLERESNPRPSG